MTAKIAGVLAILCSLIGPAFAGPDEDGVRHLLHSTFDKPDTKLVIEPVVVDADHAIAGWTQGDMGGRALLRRKGHYWQIVLCSGDQLKSTETLTLVGLPPAAAKALAGKFMKAETATDPKRLALFSRFDGIVMIGADGHHPPH